MPTIRFPDDDSKRRALELMAGRFSFQSSSTGEIIAPDACLGPLIDAGISFSVQGPATIERGIPKLQDPPATPS